VEPFSWNNILAFFADSYDCICDRITILGIIAASGFYGKQFIEMLEKEQLAYIIAVRLIRPLPSGNRTPKDWQCLISPSYIPSGERRDGIAKSDRASSHEPVYNLWTLCKLRANDKNTIKEL